MNADAAGAAAAGDGRDQVLTFTVEGQDYGVDILRVQEIKGWAGATPIPNAPAWVKGVMNLRGTVVPVIDLRLRFGLAAREADRFTVIVVVNVGARVVGMVVDAVSDVLDLDRAAIEPPPDLGGLLDVTAIRGIARHADRLVTLLDVDAVADLGAGGRPGEAAAA